MNLTIVPNVRRELAGLREGAAEDASYKAGAVSHLLTIFRSLQKPLFSTFGIGAGALAKALADKDLVEIDISEALLDRLRSKSVPIWKRAAMEHCEGNSFANLIAYLNLPLDSNQPASIAFAIRVEVRDDMEERLEKAVQTAGAVLTCKLGAKIEEIVPLY